MGMLVVYAMAIISVLTACSFVYIKYPDWYKDVAFHHENLVVINGYLLMAGLLVLAIYAIRSISGGGRRARR